MDTNPESLLGHNDRCTYIRDLVYGYPILLPDCKIYIHLARFESASCLFRLRFRTLQLMYYSAFAAVRRL